jgi:hypothetical protein
MPEQKKRPMDIIVSRHFLRRRARAEERRLRVAYPRLRVAKAGRGTIYRWYVEVVR